MSVQEPSVQAADTIEQALLLLMSEHRLRDPFVTIGCMSLLAWFASDDVPAYLWGTWLLLVCIAQGIRWVVMPRLPLATHIPVARRLRYAVSVTAMNGFLHGLSLYCFPLFTEVERAIQTIMFMGLSTFSLMLSAGYRPVAVAYVLPTLVPLYTLWGFNPGLGGQQDRAIMVAVLGLFYSFSLVRVSRNIYSMFEATYRAQHQQLELNEKLHKALHKAKQASASKTRFLASASHDLRQPIHTLSLFSAALGMRPLDDKSREIAHHMDLALRSVANQLDSLLDISKLDAGVVSIKPEPVNLGQLLTRLAPEFSAEADSKQLVFIVQAIDDAVVYTDPAILEGILRNLLSNALKYTDQGSITLSARCDRHQYKVQVADTGRGIAAGEQVKVFEEFYQVDNPERDRSKGLGLGLAIVERQVALLDFCLTLESSVGEGTRVTIALPASVQHLPADRDEAEPKVNLVGLKVLVVDDEVDVGLGMKTLLEGLRCEVRNARGTGEAVAALKNFAPDILLADLRLRGTDSGFKTVVAIRHHLPRLPALLISGDTAPDRLREAEQAQLQLLHKPVSTEVLIRAMARQLHLGNDSHDKDSN